MSEPQAEATASVATNEMMPPPSVPVIDQKPTATSAAEDSSATTQSAPAKASGIKPPTSRIGRPCCQGHGAPKAGPPPLAEQHSDTTTTATTAMRRQQSDDYSRSHLADVFEESEADLVTERIDRSTKSRSPSEGGSSSGAVQRGHRTDRKVSNGSLNSEHYLEATGNRRSSDQSVVLTADTDSFIIGQRIWVGGHRPGHIAYIGETHFAPGDWAGVVLDDPSGKNDGCVSGKRYFQCEPKRGIFSRLTRLTREPLGGSDMSMNASMLSMASPGRSGTASPTQSMRSFATGIGRTPSKAGNLAVGDRIIVSSGLGSRPGILKYIGETHFASGTWCGVQLDEATGKNDGSIDNERYFECPPNYGVFVPVAKVSLSPSSRKTRLSRAGSKESLTSVGTIGSMASTVTSRMRLSGVQQRLSTPSKPLTTPKNILALQDILREKQNHIEQLLLERDLVKQDADGQIITYQKNINQLKDTILALEQRLISETKKTEDLQASIEEATFCGDELNAQSQDYRERITKLEALLVEHQSGQSEKEAANYAVQLQKMADEMAAQKTALDAAEAQLKQRTDELVALGDKLKDFEANSEVSMSSLVSSEQNLREEIKYIQSENDQLKTELREKDESKEKEYLAMKHIEHELKEELLSAQQQIKVHEASMASNDGALQQMIKEKDQLISELRTAATGSIDVHQLEISHKLAEIESLKSALKESSQTIDTLSTERSNQNENEQKQQLIIAQHQTTIEETSTLIVKLQNDIASQQEIRENLQAQLVEQSKSIAKLESDADVLRQENVNWSSKMQDLQTSNKSLSEIIVKEKDDQIADLINDLAKLKEELQGVTAKKASVEADLLSREQQIEENDLLIAELQSNYKLVHSTNSELQNKLAEAELNQNAKEDMLSKLTSELAVLHASTAERNTEIECLKTEFIKKEDDNRQLHQQIAELTEELAQLRQLGENDSAQIGQLNEKIAASNELYEKHNLQVSLMTKEIESLTKHVEELTAENTNILKQLTEQTSALEETNGQLTQKSENLNSIQQENDKLHETVSKYELEHAKSEKHASELVVKLNESNTESSNVKDKLSKLEVEYADLQRQMTIIESKLEQSAQEKVSLQQNLDALQCTSSDTNSEIRRLTEELQTKHTAFADATDKSNVAQLALERKLHEQTQNLAARTTQWERIKEEMETLTTQKIDRENELNLELSKIKEASENEREVLLSETNAMRMSFEKEKELLVADIDRHLSEANNLRGQLNEAVSNMETTITNLQTDIEKGRVEFEIKEKEFNQNALALENVQSNLQKELKAAQEVETTLRSSLVSATTNASNEHGSLIQKLQESHDQQQQITGQLEELRTQLDVLTASSQSAEKRITELTEERDLLLISSQKEVADLKATIIEQTDKVKELTEQFQITEDDQVDLVNKNLELVEQITLLRQQLSEADERFGETDTQCKSLLTKLDESAAIISTTESQLANEKKALSQLVEQEQTQRSQLSENNTTLSEVTQQLEIAQRSLKERDQSELAIKAELEVERQKRDELLKVTEAEVNNKAEQVRYLEEKIMQLTSSANLSVDLKNELTTKAEELRSKDSHIETLTTEVAALREVQHRQDAELANVQQELATQQSQENALKQAHLREISGLQDKIETLERTLENQVEEVLGDKNKLVGECESLNAIIAQQQIDFQERMKLYEVRSKFDALRDELALMENAKRAEVEELSAKLLSAETQLAGQTVSVQRLDAIQRNEKDLQYEKTALERREQQLMLENQQLTVKLNAMKNESAVSGSGVAPINSDDDSTGQIAFLNSIIADMQKKNENLVLRINALELGPEDFIKNGLYDVPIRREPAPRMFCDICDIFDAHETEDCPQQASDSPPPAAVLIDPSTGAPKERKIPPPRKYCEICESFGHEAAECDTDETF